MIRCGHCGDRHETTAAVRACSTSSWRARGKSRTERSHPDAPYRPSIDTDLADSLSVASDHYWDAQMQQRELAEDRRVAEYKAARDARLTAPTRTPPEQEGLYRRDGVLYQLLRGKDSGKLYAKRVDFVAGKQRPVLTYVRGMVFQLDAGDLVPADEAQELTRRTGWCVFGHFLTNPVSIARGMGPVCYARYPQFAKVADAA